MHSPEDGHECPLCTAPSICTIEDGFCENQGTCNECIKEQVYEDMDREMGYSSWACSHGLYEGEDCPLCEHGNGDHTEEWKIEVEDGIWTPEFDCLLCENPTLTNQEATEEFTLVLNSYFGGR